MDCIFYWTISYENNGVLIIHNEQPNYDCPPRYNGGGMTWTKKAMYIRTTQPTQKHMMKKRWLTADLIIAKYNITMITIILIITIIIKVR